VYILRNRNNRWGPRNCTNLSRSVSNEKEDEKVEVAETGKITLTGAERASLDWLKAWASTFNGQCVEVAAAQNAVAIRDSKDPNGPILVYTHAEFKAFLDGARNGEFDSFVQ
jgi:hypothetical protein